MRTLHSILLLIFTITTSAHAQPRGIIDEQTLDEQVQAASAELIGTWQGLLGDTGLRIRIDYDKDARTVTVTDRPPSFVTIDWIGPGKTTRFLTITCAASVTLALTIMR